MGRRIAFWMAMTLMVAMLPLAATFGIETAGVIFAVGFLAIGVVMLVANNMS